MRRKKAHLCGIPAVADLYGVPVGRVQQLIDEGELRVVPPSNEERIHRADLLDCLSRHPNLRDPEEKHPQNV